MASGRGIGALAAAALVGAVVGAGAAGWIGGQRQREALAADAGRIAALEAARAVLEQQIAEERAAGAALVARLEQQEQREPLAPPEPPAAEREPAEPAPPAPAAAPPAAALAGRLPPSHAGAAGVPAFDPAPVLAAGFPPEEVERFRSRLDELELERLYLRDRAAREGWLDTPRFQEESGALGREFLGLRDEFDEGLYDWVLYSSGHQNRVAVTEVLSGSAAEAAGLRGGDVILRYDQRRVLSPSELRDATVGGRAGELVPIEVQRAGDPAPLRVFVPRGPLGVRMAPTRVEPPPAG